MNRRSTRPRHDENSRLTALFVLLVWSATPANADDLIEQWLKQDEISGQTLEARQDLNALTDEQWNEIFKIRLDQPDVELGRLLVERARETPTHVLPL